MLDNNISKLFSLKGKKILITGASSGIGRQCAIDCSRQGAIVTIMGRDDSKLEETLSLMFGEYHSVIKHDFNDLTLDALGAIQQLVRQRIEWGGVFDGFIHCAGIELTKPLRNLKYEDFIKLYNINFLSGILILKILSKKGFYNLGFSAVFISSISALIPRIGTLAYTSTKGAIISSIIELASELKSKGINVNCISPGTILTPMMISYLDSLTEEEKNRRKEGFPLGLGKCEDISYACLYLLSDAAKRITGQNIIIDGGYTIK